MNTTNTPMISRLDLKMCAPYATNLNIDKYYLPISDTLSRYAINTPLRIAHFLTQVIHESGSFKYVEELASGDAYDTRTDLGNTKEVDGDGRKYKGRGLIQITGKTNYELLSKALNYDFVNNPEKLKLPGAAAMSAGWFWKVRMLNEIADSDNLLKISVLVNGRNKSTGLPNGWVDRQNNLLICKRVLKIKL